MFGIDISNHQGEISPALAACFVEQGIEAAVVRLSLEDEAKHQRARRQLAALGDAGLRLAGYIWEYVLGDGADTAAQALDWYGDLPILRYAVDAEETKYVADVARNIEWLHQCLAYLDQAQIPDAIYTANWWWQPYMGGTAEFAGYPLWVAEYDTVPDLAVFYPFGGWASCAGKQYTGSGGLCGLRPLDLDVFDPSFFAGQEDDRMTARQMEIARVEIAGNILKALQYKLPKKAREALESGALPAANTLGRGEE